MPKEECKYCKLFWIVFALVVIAIIIFYATSGSPKSSNTEMAASDTTTTDVKSNDLVPVQNA